MSTLRPAAAAHGESGGPARLHHIALGARDVEAVAAFYRDLLGLPELNRFSDTGGRLRSVWLDLGGPILMIERTGEPVRRVRGVGAGLFLVALSAPAGARSEREIALAAAGFPVESRTEHTIYLRDVEGNRVAISSYPAELRQAKRP